MLKPEEKAYCEALVALKQKQYEEAARRFQQAAAGFRDDKEFRLLKESTELLVATKSEIARLNR
jgi:hypothetical protein